MSKIARSYRADFLSDGSNVVSFDITKPPLNIEGTPSWLLNAYFRDTNNVALVPPMRNCTLSGTTITATFGGPLPEKNTQGFMARYALGFTLVYE